MIVPTVSASKLEEAERIAKQRGEFLARGGVVKREPGFKEVIPRSKSKPKVKVAKPEPVPKVEVKPKSKAKRVSNNKGHFVVYSNGLTAQQMSERSGLSTQCIRQRIYKGWPESEWMAPRKAGGPAKVVHANGMTVAEMADESGLSEFTIAGRINRGWPMEEWMDPPRANDHDSKVYSNGMTARQMAEASGVSIKTIRSRLYNKWPVEMLTKPTNSGRVNIPAKRHFGYTVKEVMAITGLTEGGAYKRIMTARSKEELLRKKGVRR